MKTYKILDIFSYLHADLMSLERLEKIFYDGIDNTEYRMDVYSVQKYQTDDVIDDSVQQLVKELTSEGRKVAFIKRDEQIIATVGYKEIT